MFAVTNTCALLGTEAQPVEVEVRIVRGLPHLGIVGMRDADARECRERIRCGLAAAGIALPLARVTVSLAPADIPKSGAGFDLPVLIALLEAMGEIPEGASQRIGSIGEVGLDGDVRAVLGSLAASLVASRMQWTGFFVAAPSADSCAHASIPVHAVRTISELIGHLRGERQIAPIEAGAVAQAAPTDLDLADVRGQSEAVVAAQVAAAGGHSLLLYGPPGCGKSMISRRLPGLLPALDRDEALEVATIHDAAGLDVTHVSSERPFRDPHHTITPSALVGGGSLRAQVGEISLAHRGVLFLDELPEFRPSAIDALRQPLEQRQITVRRATWLARFPADFQLVAAMNLCRCGRYGSRGGTPCSCTPTAREQYCNRVSGAIINRFQCKAQLVEPVGSIAELPAGPASAAVRDRVCTAWERQHHRWGGPLRNAFAPTRDSRAYRLTREARQLMTSVCTGGSVGGRAQEALMRVARTLADIADDAAVSAEHVNTALMLIREPEWTETQ